MTRRIVQALAVLFAMALLTASGWIEFRTWPRPLPLAAQPIPSVQFDHGTMVVPLPTKALLAEVGRFDDEISAYLLVRLLAQLSWHRYSPLAGGKQKTPDKLVYCHIPETGRGQARDTMRFV